MGKKQLLGLGLVLAIAAAGWGSVFYATPYGIGTSPDSAVYIGVARNFVSGHGLTTSSFPNIYRPLTQYPPFYPIVLALASWTGQSGDHAGRGLAGLITFLNILGVGGLLLRLIPFSIWPAVVGASIMLLAPAMVDIHLMAWSEPLFILLSLCAFSTLAEYLPNRSRAWLLLSACLTSLAVLTRYAGLTIIGAGVLGIFIIAQASLKQRIIDIFVFGLVSLLPLLSVLGYNLQTAGTATNRVIGIHPITLAQLSQGLATFSSWLGMPYQQSPWLHLLITAAFFFILSGTLIFSQRSRRRLINIETYPGRLPPFIWLLIFYTGLYGLFLVVSISLVDANTPLDNRILSPLYVNLLIITIYSVSIGISTVNSGLWRWFSAGIAGILILIYASSSMTLIQDYHHTGIGYSTPYWQNSRLIKLIQALPDPLAIYSNAPDAISLLANRPAARLPRVFEQSTQQNNLEYPSEMTALGKQMAAGKAMIVYFDQPTRSTNPTLSDIKSILDVAVLEQTDGGWIFTLPNSAGRSP